MAQFTNQAQLSYNNTVVSSNIAVGEILEALSVVKTPVSETYSAGDSVVYAISVINSGASPYTGVSLTDDLGAYGFGALTLYPLTFVEGSVKMFINGAPAQPPAVSSAGGTLEITGLNVPAGGNILILYEAGVSNYAPPGQTGNITNTVTLGGSAPEGVSASATITPDQAAKLSITKSIEPVPVAENGEVTYTLTIRNTGGTEADASYNVTLTDTFEPLLTGISVTFNGSPMSEGTDYTYDQITGAFSTVAGKITVPAATFTQDPDTGVWSVCPGVGTVVITGNIA